MKNIVVQGCTLVCKFGGVASIVTPPSSTTIIDNHNVYSGPLTISVTGSSAGGADANATGVGILTPSSQYNQVDDKFVVLEGDKVDIVVNGATSKGSATTGTETVTITQAGQTSTSAD